MSEYEQTELDLRLDSEKQLEENISQVVLFANMQLTEDLQDWERIRNRHEGYGVLAEKHNLLQAAMKGVGEDMKEYLKILPSNDAQALQTAGRLENSLTKAITAAVRMAAECKRVADDLNEVEKARLTPLEEWAESREEYEEFEEAPDETAEVEADGETITATEEDLTDGEE